MKLNLIAPINNLGYGYSGLNILLGLVAKGYEVALFPIGQISCPDEHEEVVRQCVANADMYTPSAPSLRIWHQNRLAEHVGKGPRLGFAFFELEPLTAVEVHHINQLDKFLVASHWAKYVAEVSGVTVPIAVVPLGVDRSIFNESVKVDRLMPDHTVFCNVGKWEVRKGHDILIEVFNKAFTKHDRVILRMLSQNLFLSNGNEEWAKRYKTSPLGSKIELVVRQPTQTHVARIFASSDCGIFPARAEAWNLDLLENFSCGRFAIASYCTGQREYVSAENARLITFDEMEPAHDGVWFHGQGNWPKFGEKQKEQMIEHLRSMHRLIQTNGHIMNHAGIETAKKFTWQNTVDTLTEQLDEYR